MSARPAMLLRILALLPAAVRARADAAVLDVRQAWIACQQGSGKVAG